MAMLKSGEITQDVYDNLMIVHEERMDEKWEGLFTQKDGFVY